MNHYEKESTPTTAIEIRGLSKRFERRGGEEVRAVDDVTITVAAGEMLVLLGPSGCGKTTLMRLVAGLERPDSGSIILGGTVVFDPRARVDVAPEKRPASMVFQSYALWPHMTAFENVAYPLRSQGLSRAKAQPRVDRVLEMVGVAPLRDQYPAQMSGGQQQRIALARAIVAEQGLILFDEPLSNVDAKVREQLRHEIVRIQREFGFTGIYVTHDQEEALTLGSKIAVLRQGKVEQLGSPREIYENPATRYVAAFVGTADEIPATVEISRSGVLEMRSDSGVQWVAQGAPQPIGARVVVVARPEHWSVLEAPAPGPNCIPGTVDASMFMPGSQMEYVVSTADGKVRAWVPRGEHRAVGSKVWLRCAPEDLRVFPGDQ
jgi:iron(III) transport system ATP-binding protein